MSQLKKLLFVTFLFFVITKVQSLDPSTVDTLTKATWCNNQMTTCTNICLDGGYNVLTNFCVAETLSYDCVCSNGVRPNSTEYTQTIPYFSCTADQQVCIRNCQPATDACVGNCTAVPCGATSVKAPSKVPTVVPGTSAPAAPGVPGPTQSKSTTTLLNAAVMTSPIQGCFILLFTLVVTFFVRIN